MAAVKNCTGKPALAGVQGHMVRGQGQMGLSLFLEERLKVKQSGHVSSLSKQIWNGLKGTIGEAPLRGECSLLYWLAAEMGRASSHY